MRLVVKKEKRRKRGKKKERSIRFDREVTVRFALISSDGFSGSVTTTFRKEGRKREKVSRKNREHLDRCIVIARGTLRDVRTVPGIGRLSLSGDR